MMSRNLFSMVLIALAALIVPAAGMAEDFDGSRPLLIAIIDVIECHPGGDCEKVSPRDARIPRFFEVDFKAKEISEIGDAEEERRTEIQRMTRQEGVLILQGAQNGRGWSVSITEANGDAVIAVTDPLSGFVLFGACTPR